MGVGGRGREQWAESGNLESKHYGLGWGRTRTESHLFSKMCFVLCSFFSLLTIWMPQSETQLPFDQTQQVQRGLSRSVVLLGRAAKCENCKN